MTHVLNLCLISGDESLQQFRVMIDTGKKLREPKHGILFARGGAARQPLLNLRRRLPIMDDEIQFVVSSRR